VLAAPVQAPIPQMPIATAAPVQAKAVAAQAKPTQLSQTASLLDSFNGISGKLANLMDLQQRIRHIGRLHRPAAGAPQGKVAQAKKTGQQKVISHAIAGRVLAQLGNGASKEMVAKDLKKTKESMRLAHAAYVDKDPAAISLLQLSDSDDAAPGDTTDDEIYLFERKDDADTDDSQDAAELDEVI